jgi:hypothetical protein
MLLQFRVSTLVLRVWPSVRQKVRQTKFLFVRDSFIDGQLNPTGTFAQTHARRIVDNRGYPRGHFRATLKSSEVLVGGEQCILHCILRVSCIAEASISVPVKCRQITGDYILQIPS